MEKTEQGEFPQNSRPPKLDAMENFENEGGAVDSKSSPCQADRETKAKSVWRRTRSTFRKLKEDSAPVWIELWKGNCSAIAEWKKSASAARAAYRKQKSKRANDE